MKKGLVLIIIASLFVVATSASAINASAIYGEGPDVPQPILQVLKWVSDSEIVLGESITVYVNITNWSSSPAYNLSIIEPRFSAWDISEVVNYDVYEYVEIGGGASISYQYTETLLNEGNYTIEPTTISYVDVNGTQYNAFSSNIPINVFIQEPLPELDNLWETVRNIATIFILIPGIIVLYMKYKN